MLSRWSCIFGLGAMLQVSGASARVFSWRIHKSMAPLKVELVGFSAAEEKTIQRAIDFLASRLADIESDPSIFLSRYERCVAKYATKDFLFWDSKVSSLENKYRNAYATYADLTRVIQLHLDKKMPVSIGAITEPASVWGACLIGFRPEADDFSDLYIELNRAALQKHPTAVAAWAGTIFHEFLHRTGLTHPSGYSGSLVRESEGCVARGFADKNSRAPTASR